MFSLFEMNMQGRPPAAHNNPLMPQNDSEMTMASVFKPFKFGNLMKINRAWLIKQSNYKLNKVNNLQKRMMQKANDPQSKDANKYKINANFCAKAYRIHHEYVSKLIFWKSRSMFLRGPQIKQLYEQYSRFLFVLSQSYQRETLGLGQINTRNY